MNARTLILVIALLLVVSLSFAGDVEKCYGTWVNPEYDKIIKKSALVIIKSDGTAEYYWFLLDKTPHVAYTYTVTDSWKDSEGNIYFEIKEEAEQQIFNPIYYALWKLSNTGETLEMESTHWDYPTELDTDSFYYRIYYRQ
jgi:hypothetical protein